MPLGLNTKIFFDKLKSDPRPPIKMGDLSIEEFRRACNDGFSQYSAGLPTGVKESDFVEHFLTLDSGYLFRVQIYTPPSIAINAVVPTIIYFHGGGFCLNLNIHQGPCALMANISKCRIIAFDYPLAPEYNAKQILDISYEAVSFLYEHAAIYNIDRDALIVVGCSSGGALAALVVNRSIGSSDLNIFQQILISPLVDLTLQTHKHNPYLEFQKEDILLTEDALQYFVSTFVQNTDPKSPEVSPLFQRDFSRLPETLILVGEYDALRADGAIYAECIRKSGQIIDLITCEGQTHNFNSCRAVLNDGDDPAKLAAQYILTKLHEK